MLFLLHHELVTFKDLLYLFVHVLRFEKLR